MGVDFSHSEARWSYSGFDSFRKTLKELVTDSSDDINLFLGSGDSQTCFSSNECRKIAPRLMYYLLYNPEHFNHYDLENARLLTFGMLDAWSKNEIFEIM